MKKELKSLPAFLLPWYYANRRDLPWRQDKDPYHIWLSEIMLQQTRVEAVKGYYTRFLQQIPTVATLAEAEDDLLHKLWEGLGYYSRVRNLKKAAQIVMTQFGGIFPTEYEKVLSLPGIGAYTAGAVCSIAYNQKVPAVDGNVLRVYSRLTNDDMPIDLQEMKKKVSEALEKIYPYEAGDFTQALMELGATLCGPNRKPQCENCPCREICAAYLAGTQEKLPCRLPKKTRKTEKRTVFILECDGLYAVEKRIEPGLLQGLWQFPNIQGHLKESECVSRLQEQGITVTDFMKRLDKSHIFTHIRWDMQGYYLKVRETAKPYRWLTLEDIRAQISLPTAFRVFLDPLEEK